MRQVTLKFLYLFLIPIVLLNLFIHMSWGLLIRFKSIFIKLKPDAVLLKNVLSSEVYAKPSINSILPVHSIGNYLGDIFGYFNEKGQLF